MLFSYHAPLDQSLLLHFYFLLLCCSENILSLSEKCFVLFGIIWSLLLFKCQIKWNIYGISMALEYICFTFFVLKQRFLRVLKMF